MYSTLVSEMYRLRVNLSKSVLIPISGC